MKQMKIALVAMLAVLMGTTFTSCLDSDSGSSWDGSAVVTTSNYMGGLTLLTDEGYTLIPSNPSVLQYTDGSYVKRSQITFSWNEGVIFDGNRNKSYGITIDQIYSVFPVFDYTLRPDTIEHDFPISEITNLWGANGEYLTVGWKYNYAGKEVVNFELYPFKVEDNVLIMRLVQSLGSEGYYTSEPVCASYTMPTLSEINSILGTNLNATNDSISVKIATKKSSSSEDLTNTNVIKVKVYE